MANMILDSYTFAKQPSEMTMIEKDKFASSLLTYTSVAYFSWGTTLVGKIITLRWGGMTTTQFDTLQSKYEADAEVVWEPNQGDSADRSFNVEISRLVGGYHMSLLDSADYRIDVEMDLVIMSEV
jgi:hypothetical protein